MPKCVKRTSKTIQDLSKGQNVQLPEMLIGILLNAKNCVELQKLCGEGH